MKLSEIEVGKEYAVGAEDYPTRAIVLEKGTFPVTTYSGRFGMSATTREHKGVKVQLVHRDGTPSSRRVEREITAADTAAAMSGEVFETAKTSSGKTVIVTHVPTIQWYLPQQVRWTWDVQQDRLDRKAQQEARAAALSVRTKDQHADVVAALEAHGLPTHKASPYYTGGKVELSYTEFLKLVGGES